MRNILLLAVLLVGFTFSKAQNPDATALLIIDIQNFYFPGGASALDEPEKAADNAKLLLEHFRSENGLVVHIKHQFEPDGDINKRVAPIEEEKIFTKTEVNSFLNTRLKEYLDSKSIKKVVLCGMQTHMCLEAATRAAHDFGYSCVVVEDACATRDLNYNDVLIPAKEVHYSTLATLKNYATILRTSNFLNQQN